MVLSSLYDSWTQKKLEKAAEDRLNMQQVKEGSDQAFIFLG